MSDSTCQNTISTSPLPEPNLAKWLEEAKKDTKAPYVGMYLTHNGVVRATPKKVVRAHEYQTQEEAASQSKPHKAVQQDSCNDSKTETQEVIAVDFSYDEEGLRKALEEARTWEGIYYVRAWLNSGRIPVGGSLMYVLIGADIRPHAIDALNKLVGHIKADLVVETEVYAS